MRQIYNTIKDIIRKNEVIGKYFFSKDTMRFFHSRILPRIYTAPAGAYFITSERMDMDHQRLYSLRFADLNGEIDTIGPFNKFSKSSVQTFLKYHLAIHDLEGQMQSMIEGEELTECQQQIQKLQTKIESYVGVQS